MPAMWKRRVWIWGAVLAYLGLAVLAALSAGGAVLAQADPTPTPGLDDGVYGELDGPRPPISEGSAAWTVTDPVFESHYPDGFTFEITAASSAAPIRNARVVWQHAPGTNYQNSVGAEYDEDRGRWVARWTPTGSGGIPPWVLVRYRWELTDEQANRYVTGERDEVYADTVNAARWNHVEDQDVVVYWIGLPDEIGQMTLDAMAAQRETYRQAWGGLLPYRPRVILYGWADMALYQEVIGGPIQAAGGIVAGTTAADWGGTIQLALPGRELEETAYGTVLHEVAHLYQEQFSYTIVDWFIEGNAEFFSRHRDPADYRAYALTRLQSNDPLSFAGGFSARGRNFQDAYILATTVWDYLVERYGLDAHRQVWQLIARNVPRFEAIERVTGVSIQQFEMDWRAWVGVTTPPPTLIPEPTPMLDIFNRPTPTFPSPGG